MSDQRVIYEKKGRLARVALNRPDSLQRHRCAVGRRAEGCAE